VKIVFVGHFDDLRLLMYQTYGCWLCLVSIKVWQNQKHHRIHMSGYRAIGMGRKGLCVRGSSLLKSHDSHSSLSSATEMCDMEKRQCCIPAITRQPCISSENIDP
jgi:hypothetical protein